MIDGDRGGDGDLYELVIPAVLAQRAGRQDWRGGKLHALRPVFLELGIPAALVYETLEQARAPLSSFELITAAGLSRSAAYAALETLSAFNLAGQRGGRWSVVAMTSLTVLAEQFGVLETIRTTVQRHRDERAAHRRSLANGGGEAVPVPRPRRLAVAAAGPATTRRRHRVGSARADPGRTPRSGVS